MHRPTVGWCPRSCSGPPTHSERAGNGDKLLYCDTHAYWRRKTIRLPLVRRMRAGGGRWPSGWSLVGLVGEHVAAEWDPGP